MPIAFLRYDDLKIYYILNSSIIKSTKYSSICSLNERENISTTLIHYFMKSNKFQLGIKVFEGLTSMDPENIKNWRGLIDLSYYINDQERVTKYFGQFIDFKNKQALSDNVDLDKNLFMSDYYTYSIGHLSFIAEAALIMEITDCGSTGSIFLGLTNAEISNQSILDSITNRFKNIHYVNESDVNQFLYTKKYENPFEFRKKYNNEWLNVFSVRDIIYKDSGLATLNGLLTLPDRCEKDGFLFMQSFGFTADDWFVSIHIRERNDGSARNSKINNYIEAIREITSKGGWVVRIEVIIRYLCQKWKSNRLQSV